MTETTYKGHCQHCKWSRGRFACKELVMVRNAGDCKEWAPRKLSRAERRKTKRLATNGDRGGA